MNSSNWFERKVRYCRLVVLAIILLILGSPIMAQSAKQYRSSGDAAMAKGDYYNAAEYYRLGIEKNEYSIELRYQYAEALRAGSDYLSAYTAYKKVMSEDATRVYPLATFYTALMARYLGQYEEALKLYQRFINKYKTKGEYLDKATQEINSISWVLDRSNVQDKVTINHLPTTINSSYSEANPLLNREGKMLFSSLRNVAEGNKKSLYLSRLYLVDSISKPAVIFNIPNSNETKHIGNACYSADYRWLYYTQCEAEVPNESKLHCQLYSQAVADSSAKPTLLNNGINSDIYTATQPATGVDDSGKEVLYFASDRQDGYGKTDIWLCHMVEGKVVDSPINLGGTINTPDEEYSPYFDRDSAMLYFSSSWHYGYGGLDMFKSQRRSNKWTSPINLGASINSPQNDLYYYHSPDRRQHYFASNRKGSLSLKSETCCYDLWSYESGEQRAKNQEPRTKNQESRVATQDPKLNNLEVRIDSPKLKVQSPLPKTKIDKTIASIQNLLPVTLYFHNDEPECCNLRDSTPLNYITTYQAYILLINQYKAQYGAGLLDSSRRESDSAIFSLFADKVEKGHRDLVEFNADLLDILEAGKKVEITIKGYCSPLNYNLYNIRLGCRRAASLLNYFYHYQEGKYLPYLDTRQLTFIWQSYGEETASKYVSDRREDPRNSVYNPAAALERKVQIISLVVK